MSLTSKQTTLSTPTGVGRKDYSQNVEYSVEKELRSLQERFFYSYRFAGLSPVVFPNVYESLLQFLVGSSLQYEAPSGTPWMFYLAEATTNRLALCVMTFNRYASYQDFLLGNIAERLGTSFGLVDAKLEFTKGVKTVPGSLYSIQYADFNPGAFDMDIIVHGLIGGVEELA
jgi:hypothetical protein